MSFPTQQVYIHTGSWDDETRQHPAMKWFETYTKEVIDGRQFDKDPLADHISDFVMVKSTGQQVKGAEAALKSLGTEIYAPFSSHLHDPEFLIGM